MNVCIIPARGGSRRISRKNIRPFHGKPIIAYSIEAAKASGLFDVIAVSTEDDEIGATAEACGAQYWRRNKEQSEDHVGTQKVMKHVLEGSTAKFDYACCLYPCAPLLTAADLINGLVYLACAGKQYAYIHGLYYWGSTEAFLNDITLDHGTEVPYQVSRYIDINTEEDWKRAEEMYAKLHG